MSHTAKSIAYNAIFLGRRILLSLIAVFMLDHTVFQVQLHLFCTFLIFLFIVKQNPFNSVRIYRMEIFNEVCIMLVSYSLFALTDLHNENPQTLYDIGWFPIIVILLNTIVNLLFISLLTLKAMLQTLRSLFDKARAYLSILRQSPNFKLLNLNLTSGISLRLSLSSTRGLSN